MKTKLILTTFAILLAMSSPADDATSSIANPAPTAVFSPGTDLSGRFGAGFILGKPTGVSLKYFLNDTIAVDAAVGWDFHDESVPVYGDLLWHKFDLITVPRGQLPFYLGVGGRVEIRSHDEDRVGLRVPFGASYIFDSLPLDVFAEIAPILDFTPSVRGGFTVGIGARWWF